MPRPTTTARFRLEHTPVPQRALAPIPPAKYQIPAVGTIIRIETPNWSPVLRALFPMEPETIQYEGTVLPSNSWLLPGEFNMSSNNKEYPIRTVQIARVEKLETLGVNKETGFFKESILEHALRVIKVPSRTSDEIYTVTVTHGMHATCSCKGFGFRSRCGHIPQNLEQYLKDNPEEDKSPTLHEPNTRELTARADIYPGAAARLAREASSRAKTKAKSSNKDVKHETKAKATNPSFKTAAKKQTKMELCVELVRKYPKLTSGEYIDRFQKKIGLTLAGARTYLTLVRRKVKSLP